MKSKLKSGLVVSCQAEGDDPFNSPLGVSMFAKAAEMGGAVAIRSEGIEKTRRIIETVSIPVIGLIKSNYKNGYVRITRDENDVVSLIDLGVSVIAIDGTNRPCDKFENGSEFIRYIKSKYGCEIMADISNTTEAISCVKSGADYISTTLNGYTPQTKRKNLVNPNFKLLQDLIHMVEKPVFAEGRINSKSDIRKAVKIGVYGVVVGSAITRPRIITKTFASIFKENEKYKTK